MENKFKILIASLGALLVSFILAVVSGETNNPSAEAWSMVFSFVFGGFGLMTLIDFGSKL